jgi:hypothetical protein
MFHRERPEKEYRWVDIVFVMTVAETNLPQPFVQEIPAGHHRLLRSC